MRAKSSLLTPVLAIALGGTVLVGTVLVGAAEAAPAKYTHAQAAAQLRQAGIGWSSTGNCSDWNNRRCTSFTNINKTTIAGVVAFKGASRCTVVVTGGTEVGHASGRYSHRNGYKVDVSTRYRCVTRYITRNFERAGTRPDGAPLYKSRAGNVYANEGNHWDITYYNGRV
ncbi:hypothetical protein [Streptomyces clavuligerus]|nr:hypothetical protein [Streptomyces clavuligerus]ANW22251.1 hypothetical protein BB341_28375 [Streptomyces clavuligerus]AXU17146.1 hypothetical protein D1794_31435 [Streptomyces clavuligerus]EDY47688.1 conserved hypothetical protein [Streptomyces clavuligerus]MBY6307207.1 hypothetical protein [Streptomyces clavuligerus]QCS10214.1 hypothetical protein CRV15_32130 [Streptomyces clavuligerus]